MNRLLAGMISPTDYRTVERLRALYGAFWDLNVSLAAVNEQLDGLCSWYYGFHFGQSFDYFGPAHRPKRLASEFIKEPDGPYAKLDAFLKAALLVPTSGFPEDLEQPLSGLAQSFLRRIGGFVNGGPAYEVCRQASYDFLYVLTTVDMSVRPGQSRTELLGLAGESLLCALKMLCDVLEARERDLVCAPGGWIPPSALRPPEMSDSFVKSLRLELRKFKKDLQAKRKSEQDMPELSELSTGKFAQLEDSVRFSIEHPNSTVHNCCKRSFVFRSDGYADYKSLYRHIRRRPCHWDAMRLRLETQGVVMTR